MIGRKSAGGVCRGPGRGVPGCAGVGKVWNSSNGAGCAGVAGVAGVFLTPHEDAAFYPPEKVKKKCI